MSGCAGTGCVNRSRKNPILIFHQIPTNKQKEIKQEWLRRIKRGPNEKRLPNDSTLYICSEHFERHCFERDLQVSFINVYNVEKISVKILIETSLVNNFSESFCVFFWTFFEILKEKVNGEILP